MRVGVWSAIAFAVVGNVAVAFAADKPDDIKENRVEARLSHDARLRGQDIHVDVDEGVARIKGKVATAADKARAEQLAAKVVGVRSVDNQLEVDPAVAKDRIEHNADKAKERIDDNAKKAKDRISCDESVPIVTTLAEAQNQIEELTHPLIATSSNAAGELHSSESQIAGTK